MAFDQSTRNRLARFVGDARSLLSEEFTRQLQNEYGMDPDSGTVSDLDKLTALDDSRRETARILRETMDYYLAGKADDKKNRQEVLQRIVREQAFTVLNRLSALRMAESRGILIESIAQGYQSKGFQLYARLAGSGLGETGNVYQTYLFSLFDEFAVDLALLFDRFSPQGRLFPRETSLLKLLELINDPEIEQLWAEDETIGWIYQYFNTKEERQEMRAASQAPRNSRELAVRNQFFTPRYVVEFLTDNTLGRIWYEMTKVETSLKDSCHYLVRRPTEIFLKEGEEAPEQEVEDENLSQEELLKQPVYIPYRPLKDPREIKMLDPACGSMHFGLYAFDLFEQIYAEAWDLEESLGSNALWRLADLESLHGTYPDRESFLRDVPRLIIERNIHGVDIDPRAVQIAGLSLWLRAQKSWQAQDVKPQDRPQIRHSNIVCAEPMPGDKKMLEEFLQGLKEDRLETLMRKAMNIPVSQKVRATKAMADALAKLVRTIWQEMELAGEAGSLLKVEETLREAIDKARKESEEKAPLFQALEYGTTDDNNNRLDFWNQAEILVLAALETYAEQAVNGGSFRRRLFAGDAAQGFAFIDLCRKRYDTILMNPPFGEAARTSKNYIEANFPYSASDIYQAFVERGLHWLNDVGREGVISARTGFFLGNSKEWRSNIIFKMKVVCFADLGLGVLDDALVEVAAYVIENAKVNKNLIFTDRQLDSRDKEERLLRSVNATKAGNEGGFNSFMQSLVEIIPDFTFAYWAPASLLRRYSEKSNFRKIVGRVRQGIATGDDFRFVRLGWEVSNENIGRNKRWQRFSKGGEYSPPYDDIHLLLDWWKNGSQLEASPSARFQNIEQMFLPGATYTVRTASAFAGKVLPADCMFSHNAQTWFAKSTDFTLISIGYLSCRVPQTFLELAVGSGDIATAGSVARRYTTAVVESVPSAPVNQLNEIEVISAIKKLFQFRLNDLMANETSCNYCNFYLDSTSRTLEDVAAIKHRSFMKLIVEALQASAKLDANISMAFELTSEERAFVDNEVGPHPTEYSNDADEIDVIRLYTLSEEKLIAEAIAKYGSKRWFTKKSYFVDRKLEIICHYLQSSPESVVKTLLKNSKMFNLDGSARRIISESLGCIFGRWDIQYANSEKPAPPLPSPFTSLPSCPPGMLQNSLGLPATEKDTLKNYPLHVTWGGILVDDEGHPKDVEKQTRQVLQVIWDERAEIIENEICQVLGVRTLREYLQKSTMFFADHLNLYSKSRRQAPIYWPISTPSNSYTLWLYYHRLNGQTLYTCVNDFVDPKLKQVSDDVKNLRQKKSRNSAEEKELERLVDFEQELKDFRDELLRVAKIWKPNLNDGVQITAAPLWKLFQHKPWKNKLKETWKKLEDGEYDWAHLAYSIWSDRVREKCKTDKSLAIAHDLEKLYVEPKPSLKNRTGRKKKAEETEELFDEDD